MDLLPSLCPHTLGKRLPAFQFNRRQIRTELSYCTSIFQSIRQLQNRKSIMFHSKKEKQKVPLKKGKAESSTIPFSLEQTTRLTYLVPPRTFLQQSTQNKRRKYTIAIRTRLIKPRIPQIPGSPPLNEKPSPMDSSASIK